MGVLLTSSGQAATVSWVGSTGFWDVPANWNPAVPGAADDVTLDVPGQQTVTVRSGNQSVHSVSATGDELLAVTGGTLAINGASTLAFYNQSGGTLGGAGSVTVGGVTAWTGGAMSGGGTTLAGGGLNISSDATKSLANGWTLTNSATATWSNGNIAMSNGAAIDNSGTWRDQNAADNAITDAGGAPSIFDNNGVYTKNGNSTTTIGVVFNNTSSGAGTGVVNVDAGTLSLSGGGSANSGSVFDLGNGTTLALTGGTYALNAAVTGGGTLLVDGATVNTTATVNNANLLRIAGGTLNVGGTLNTPTLQQSGGTLGGTGSVNVSGVTAWTGGSMSGGGTTLAGGGLNISSDATKSLANGWTLTNSATATWNNGNIAMSNGAAIGNSGTWQDRNAADNAITDAGGAPSIFDNNGVYTKNGNSTTTVGVVFNNTNSSAGTGVVNVDAGTLSLSGGGTANSGSVFDLGNGTTLALTGGTYALNAAVTGGGTLLVDGATVNTTATVNNANLLRIAGGTLNVGGTLNTPTLQQSGGTLGGTGSVNVGGITVWSGGSMSGGGTTLADGGLTISGNGTKSLANGWTLTNSATATWNNGNIAMSNGAVIDNNGTWQDQNAADNAITDAGGAASIFDNNGVYTKSGGGTTTVGVVFNNTSSGAGTLSLSGGGTANAGSVFNGAGTLQFGGGTYSLGAGSSVDTGNVVFGGGNTNVEGDYNVSGSTTVNGGTVNFASLPTNLLNLGSTFTINGGEVKLQHLGTQVSHYVQTGGILSGPGELRVQTAVLSGGEMLGPGRFIIEGGGGAASSLLLNGDFVLNNQSTVINSGDVRVTANAAFIGTGTFQQTAGATRVDGSWSQALTEIQAGVFGGNGTIAGPVINSGTVGMAGSHLVLNGALSGTGAYAGTVDINSSFSPGPGPQGQGIAAIDARSADLILRNSSSLNLEFGGGANGELVADSISARSIDIQGAQLNLLRLVDQPDFSPQQAFAQTVLLQTSSGFISGNFNENVSCPESSGDMFVLSKQEKQFLLTIVPRLPSVVPADVQSLASALQQIDCSPSTPASLQNLLNGLKPFLENGTADADKVEQFISALRQISPGQIAAEQTVASQIGKLQTSNVTQRLMAVRYETAAMPSTGGTGATATSGNEAAVGAAPPPSVVGVQTSAPEKEGQSSSGAPSSLSFSLSTDDKSSGVGDLGSEFSNLGLFINGQFEWADRTATAIQRGYSSTLSAVTAGADYRLSRRLLLGVSVGYGNSNAVISQRGGSQSISGYTFSSFGSLNLTDNWYIDLVNNLTYNQYASKRVTVYTDAKGAAVNETADSQTDGWQNRTSLSTGYDIPLRQWTLGVRGRTEYGYNFINSRKEHGAGLGLNMIVDDLSQESLSSSIGAMVSHALSTPVGVFVSQVNVEWEHQWFNNNSLITTRFVDAPDNAFTTNSFGIDKDYINLRAGVSAQLPYGGSAFVQYDTTFGQQYVTRHAFNVGVRFEF